MIRFFSLRLARTILTLLLIVAVSFFVLRLSGDPALAILGQDVSDKALEAFRHSWGTDRPLILQFTTYVGAVLHGDFGHSMRENATALDVVFRRVPETLRLTIPALIITLLIGIPVGVMAALKRGSFVDRALMVSAVMWFTIPSFILGLLLIMIFSVKLRWMPATGSDTWQHAILPVVTLSLTHAAVVARFTRSAMVEVLGQPYITAASAKGLIWRLVVMRHALPNAAIPVVTVVGFMIGSLAAGTVVVENVFAWPGVGRLLTDAVATRDFAVVQTILVIVGVMMVTANLIVDLLYGWFDPRLRSRRAGE